MYEVRKSIYQWATKAQKSALCNYLKALVKKMSELSVNEIWQKFYDDEKYYLEINCSRFEFVEQKLDDDEFYTESLKYLTECRKYFDYKKAQQPLIDAQKEFEKQKRAFLKDVKMQHEKPTKRQLYYYDRLCKKYGLEKENTEELSKFDLKERISKVIDEHANDYKYTD